MGTKIVRRKRRTGKDGARRTDAEGRRTVRTGECVDIGIGIGIRVGVGVVDVGGRVGIRHAECKSEAQVLFLLDLLGR